MTMYFCSVGHRLHLKWIIFPFHLKVSSGHCSGSVWGGGVGVSRKKLMTHFKQFGDPLLGPNPPVENHWFTVSAGVIHYVTHGDRMIFCCLQKYSIYRHCEKLCSFIWCKRSKQKNDIFCCCWICPDSIYFRFIIILKLCFHNMVFLKRPLSVFM